MGSGGGEQEIHGFRSCRIGIADRFNDKRFARSRESGLAQVFNYAFDRRDLAQFCIGECGGPALKEETDSVQLGDDVSA